MTIHPSTNVERPDPEPIERPDAADLIIDQPRPSAQRDAVLALIDPADFDEYAEFPRVID
jgi:hypothetical protein